MGGALQKVRLAWLDGPLELCPGASVKVKGKALTCNPDFRYGAEKDDTRGAADGLKQSLPNRATRSAATIHLPTWGRFCSVIKSLTAWRLTK